MDEIMALNSLFVSKPCPVCKANEYDVVYSSKWPKDISLDDIQASFSAASDYVLMDQMVRCRVCDMVYLNPHLRSDLIVDAYTNAVDARFVDQNKQRIHTFYRSLAAFVSRVGLSIDSSSKLLDIGCAGGACLVAAKQLGFNVHGVEPNQWLCDYAKNEYDLNIYSGILTADLFDSESIDVVTMWDVLEHIADPTDVLQIAHNILKPGGYLVLSVPDIGSIIARCLGRYWPFLLNVHLLYYSKSTINKHLTSLGFNFEYTSPLWQTLRMGYVFERAQHYIPIIGLLRKLIQLFRLDGLPFTYQMGQTIVVVRKPL